MKKIYFASISENVKQTSLVFLLKKVAHLKKSRIQYRLQYRYSVDSVVI